MSSVGANAACSFSRIVSATVMNPACLPSRGVSQEIRFLEFFTPRPHNPHMPDAKPKTRFKADIRIKPDAPHVKRAEQATLRPCARPGCEAEGGYKVTR